MNKRTQGLVREHRDQVAAVNSQVIDTAGDAWLASQKLLLGLMAYPHDLAFPFWSSVHSHLRLKMEEGMDLMETLTGSLGAGQHYGVGMLRYLHEFMNPYWTALESFAHLERNKLLQHQPLQNLMDYLELLQFNIQISDQGLAGTVRGLSDFHHEQASKALDALCRSISTRDPKTIRDYSVNLEKLLDAVVYGYPEAIRSIEPEFGFHFDGDGYVKAAETDRFVLYQVLSRDKTVKARKRGKPILIMHPYVLGPNILAFLPGEGKSYVHTYADQGIPTYVRILKDIYHHPAVQVMTGEDDARDTRYFCEYLMARHGRKVTLNGFCQGGFIAVLDILSGELDGLVDGLITCVAPMDGTKSRSLTEYMQHLPARFRDLNYALKGLPNGNRIVDGKVMGWVYKLKSMEKEAPLVTMHRDLLSIPVPEGEAVKINKTAAALNHWLIYDRSDLPEGITKLSFDSYTIPVTPDGTLPVKLFGKTLNFHGIKERGIEWLICYAEGDDLVDRDAALAPLDYIDVEVTPFPKGHGAIATSWSDSRSACALHTCFGNNYRGPVRFQLDLEAQKDG